MFCHHQVSSHLSLADLLSLRLASRFFNEWVQGILKSKNMESKEQKVDISIPEKKYACETCYLQASRSLLRHLKDDFASASVLTMHMDQSTLEQLDLGLEPVRGSRDLLHDEHEVWRVYYHMDTKAKVSKN